MLTYEELWAKMGGFIREQMELLANEMLRLAKQGLFLNYGICDVMGMHGSSGDKRTMDWLNFLVALNEDRTKKVHCNFEIGYKSMYPKIEGGVTSRFYLEYDGETLYSYNSGDDVDWRTDPKGLKKWVKGLIRRRKEIMKAILNVAGPEWQNLWE